MVGNDVNVDIINSDQEPGSDDESSIAVEPSIQAHQNDARQSTFMCSRNPEAEIVENPHRDKIITKKSHKLGTASFSIAPGEGKIPTNLMRDESWDINAFPSLFPSGRYGLNYERAKKLSPQQKQSFLPFVLDTNSTH